MRRRTLLAVVPAVAVAAALGSATPPAAGDLASASGFPGGRYFVVSCPFSHRSNDDPIVFPGQPGRSHDHTFLGNRSADADSTPASLRYGQTTCNVKADAASYWVPTLYVGLEPVVPNLALAYYVRRTKGYLRSFPPDLSMIAGNADARGPQSKSVVAWSCGGVGSTPLRSVVPACRADTPLQYRVAFPNCWNGRVTDSPNHRRHMAYSRRGRCPPSHPVAVPKLVLVLFYDAVPRGARLSSGTFGGHADFMNGWNQDSLTAYVQQI